MAGTQASRRIDRRSVRWEEHNAARRVRILDAAVELIEELPTGSEVRVHEIAERAGMVRSVIYRHFDGRADLDREIQAHVVGMVRHAVQSRIRLEGTVSEILARIVAGYVEWAERHPQLYLLADREFAGDNTHSLVDAVRTVATSVANLIRTVAAQLGVLLDAQQSATLDLLVSGLIGQVRGTVNQWIREPGAGPGSAELIELLTDAIWFQIEGFSRTVGIELRRELRVEALAAGGSTE